MLTCEFCLQSFTYTFSLFDLVHNNIKNKLCYSCRESWYLLQGSLCGFCGIEARTDECADCLHWRQMEDVPIVKNVSVFSYEGTFREAYFRYKFQGDYRLYQLFMNDIRESYLQHFFSYNDIVIVPSHEEAVQKRGYHHLSPFIEKLPAKKHELIKKVNNEHQREKSREERLLQNDEFIFSGDSVPNKILLFDDIYTTGSSIMKCAALLRNHGAKEISSLTIGRTPRQLLSNYTNDFKN